MTVMQMTWFAESIASKQNEIHEVGHEVVVAPSGR